MAASLEKLSGELDKSTKIMTDLNGKLKRGEITQNEHMKALGDMLGNMTDNLIEDSEKNDKP